MTPEQLEQETAACKAAWHEKHPSMSFDLFGREFLEGWLDGKEAMARDVAKIIAPDFVLPAVKRVPPMPAVAAPATQPGELSSADVPRDVLQAAVTIERYFSNRGKLSWTLRGIQSRWQPLKTVPDHISGDFLSHHGAWRNAIALACRSASGTDDESYWAHELAAFDRSYAALASGSAT